MPYLSKLTLKSLAICLLVSVITSSSFFISSAYADQVTSRIQAQANTMEEEFLETRDKEIESHTISAQNKIEAVNESAEMDVAKVPRFFYNAYGYPIPNQDYDRTVAYIRVDAQKAINKINMDLAAMTKTINAAYQEKLKAINSSVANVDSQIQPGTSDIQLSPQGSNLYVKNYVNYVADPPKPPASPIGLKAREKSLACKTKKANTEKPSNTN